MERSASYFAKDTGLVKEFEIDYDRHIEYETDRRVRHDSLIILPYLPISLLYCILARPQEHRNVRERVNATHIAATMDGIRLDVDNHNKAECCCLCNDEIAKSSLTLTYDHVTKCEVEESNCVSWCCCCCVMFPEHINLYIADRSLANIILKTPFETRPPPLIVKDPRAFKDTILRMKSGDMQLPPIPSSAAQPPSNVLRLLNEPGYSHEFVMDVESYTSYFYNSMFREVSIAMMIPYTIVFVPYCCCNLICNGSQPMRNKARGTHVTVTREGITVAVDGHHDMTCVECFRSRPVAAQTTTVPFDDIAGIYVCEPGTTSGSGWCCNRYNPRTIASVSVIRASTNMNVDIFGLKYPHAFRELVLQMKMLLRHQSGTAATRGLPVGATAGSGSAPQSLCMQRPPAPLAPHAAKPGTTTPPTVTSKAGTTSATSATTTAATAPASTSKVATQTPKAPTPVPASAAIELKTVSFTPTAATTSSSSNKTPPPTVATAASSTNTAKPVVSAAASATNPGATTPAAKSATNSTFAPTAPTASSSNINDATKMATTTAATSNPSSGAATTPKHTATTSSPNTANAATTSVKPSTSASTCTSTSSSTTAPVKAPTTTAATAPPPPPPPSKPSEQLPSEIAAWIKSVVQKAHLTVSDDIIRKAAMVFEDECIGSLAAINPNNTAILSAITEKTLIDGGVKVVVASAIIAAVMERVRPSTTTATTTPQVPSKAVKCYALSLTQTMGAAIVSSGTSRIANGSFDRMGSGISVKVKLSENASMLRFELGLLKQLELTFGSAAQFIRGYDIIEPGAFSFVAGDPKAPIYSCHAAMVMHAGQVDLETVLRQHSAHDLTRWNLKAIACDVIRAVAQLHSIGMAWMDIKPANFVQVYDNYMSRYVGIDLDYAIALNTPISLRNSSELTCAYACPYFMRTGSNPSTVAVTAEEYDLWSLGITLIEIFNRGKSMFSDLDSGAVQSKLATLTQRDVDSYIRSLFPNPSDISIVNTLTQLLVIEPPSRRCRARSVESLLDRKHDGAYTQQLKTEIVPQISAINNNMSSLHVKMDALMVDRDRVLDAMKTLLEQPSEIGGGSNRGAQLLLQLLDMKSAMQSNAALIRDFPKRLQLLLDASQSSLEARVVQSIQHYFSNVDSNQEVVASLDSILTELGDLKKDVQDSRMHLAFIQTILKSQSALLAEVERRGNRVPPQIIILPEPAIDSSAGWLRKGARRITELLWRKTRLLFVCSLSGELALSGKDGTGYAVSVQTDLLKSIAPMLALSVIVAKVLLSSQGIPPQLLPFPDSITDRLEFAEVYAATLESKIVSFAEQQLDQAASNLLGRGDPTASTTRQVVTDNAVKAALQVVYTIVSGLENELGVATGDLWEPRYSGLVKVAPMTGVEGTSLWVLPKYQHIYAAGGKRFVNLCKRIVSTYSSNTSTVVCTYSCPPLRQLLDDACTVVDTLYSGSSGTDDETISRRALYAMNRFMDQKER